jgi:hypothetical protein
LLLLSSIEPYMKELNHVWPNPDDAPRLSMLPPRAVSTQNKSFPFIAT